MQNFALNGGMLNGDPQVFADDTAFAVVVKASGEGLRGIAASGTAFVALSSDMPLAVMAKISGQAAVRLQAVGTLANGISILGDAKVQIKASGDFRRWVMIQGATKTTVALSGDVVVAASVSATFAMVVSADLRLNVATSRKIEGVAPVSLASTFQAYVAHGAKLSGLAQVQMAGIGRGNLMIALPPGATEIRLSASGDSRLGAMLQLEGYACIETHMRGSLESWHYVYAGGTASIGIGMMAERHGTPAIPSTYIEAPSIRALRVTEEKRRFTVPTERRV